MYISGIKIYCLLLLNTYMKPAIGQIGTVNTTLCSVDKINYVKYNNIFSLVSFNASTLNKDIVRFHLKLRYIIGERLAQNTLNTRKTIGFKLFNACGDVDRLINGLLEIFLKPNFNPLKFKSLTKVVYCLVHHKVILCNPDWECFHHSHSNKSV